MKRYKHLNVFGGCCGTDHRHVEQIALACSAILLSLIDFKWGLGLCVGLTLLYLLPPRRPRYVDDPQHKDSDLRKSPSQKSVAVEKKT